MLAVLTTDNNDLGTGQQGSIDISNSYWKWLSGQAYLVLRVAAARGVCDELFELEIMMIIVVLGQRGVRARYAPIQTSSCAAALALHVPGKPVSNEILYEILYYKRASRHTEGVSVALRDCVPRSSLSFCAPY